MEQLEARTQFTGAIEASWHGDTLRLRGDDQANYLRIERDPSNPNRAVAVGESDAGIELNPINGLFRFSIERAAFNLDIELGGGNDTVMIYGLKRLVDLRIRAGTGDDRIDLVASSVAGSLQIDAQGGLDTLGVRRTTFFGVTEINGGSNRDVFEFAQIHARKTLQLRDFHGASVINIGTTSFDRPVTIETGTKNDWTFIDTTTFKSTATIKTHDGDDHLRIRNTVFRAEPTIDDGAGNDILDRELLLSWNFADGAQGWDGGFSDFSPSKVNPEDDGVSQFEFVHGIGPLPTELGLQQTGYKFSAKNLSDDLFAFLTRPVTAADGIIGGQSYDITFGIRFASNAPAGLIGAGGPPAEAVSLGVGGVAQRPKTYLDEHGDIVINLKRGVDMSGAGDIRNGEVFGPDDSLIDSEKKQYRLVGRTKTHDNPVRSHKTGRLWLIVATKSGFEGRTTLYYASVSVRMTPSTSQRI